MNINDINDITAKSSLKSHLQVSSFQICLLLHTD